MIIYKIGRKSYIPVSMSYPKNEAIKFANRHFKKKKDQLQVEYGFFEGTELVISKKKKGSVVWVISRKENS